MFKAQALRGMAQARKALIELTQRRKVMEVERGAAAELAEIDARIQAVRSAGAPGCPAACVCVMRCTRQAGAPPLSTTCRPTAVSQAKQAQASAQRQVEDTQAWGASQRLQGEAAAWGSLAAAQVPACLVGLLASRPPCLQPTLCNPHPACPPRLPAPQA